MPSSAMSLSHAHLAIAVTFALLALLTSAQTPPAPIDPLACPARVTVGPTDFFPITFQSQQILYTACQPLSPFGLLLWNITAINSTHVLLDTLFQNSPQVPYGWIAYGPSPNGSMKGSTVAVMYGDPANTSGGPRIGFYKLVDYNPMSFIQRNPANLGINSSNAEIKDNGNTMALQNQWVAPVNSTSTTPGIFIYGQGPGYNFTSQLLIPHTIPTLFNRAVTIDFQRGIVGSLPPPGGSAPAPSPPSGPGTAIPLSNTPVTVPTSAPPPGGAPPPGPPPAAAPGGSFPPFTGTPPGPSGGSGTPTMTPVASPTAASPPSSGPTTSPSAPPPTSGPTTSPSAPPSTSGPTTSPSAPPPSPSTGAAPAVPLATLPVPPPQPAGPTAPMPFEPSAGPSLPSPEAPVGAPEGAPGPGQATGGNPPPPRPPPSPKGASHQVSLQGPTLLAVCAASLLLLV